MPRTALVVLALAWRGGVEGGWPRSALGHSQGRLPKPDAQRQDRAGKRGGTSRTQAGAPQPASTPAAAGRQGRAAYSPASPRQ